MQAMMCVVLCFKTQAVCFSVVAVDTGHDVF